jgi:hypothetical protein
VLVLAPPAQSVVLLGQVRELEVGRERAQDLALGLEVQRLDRLAQLGRRLAGAAGARQRADALLEVEERLALLLHDHAAEDLAEQADVSAERCLAVGAHPPHSCGTL